MDYYSPFRPELQQKPWTRRGMMSPSPSQQLGYSRPSTIGRMPSLNYSAIQPQARVPEIQQSLDEPPAQGTHHILVEAAILCTGKPARVSDQRLRQ